MRKFVSIPVIILILFSGVTVNLAFHYCGGMMVDKNISLSGTPASCGMEGDESHQQTAMKRICCENSFSSFTFNNTYLPSSSVKDGAADHEIPEQDIISVLLPDFTAVSSSPEALARPPGAYSTSDVELVSICIFRI